MGLIETSFYRKALRLYELQPHYQEESNRQNRMLSNIHKFKEYLVHSIEQNLQTHCAGEEIDTRVADINFAFNNRAMLQRLLKRSD